LPFSLTNWFHTTETEVVAVISKFAADVAVAEAEVDRCMKWVAQEAPTIVAGLQTAVGLAQQVGLVNPEELAAANAAVTALNAFAAASNAGKSDPSAVVAGYVAYKQAAAAVASAAATAAHAAVTANKTAVAVSAAVPAVSTPSK
jgi:hypothetical protein